MASATEATNRLPQVASLPGLRNQPRASARPVGAPGLPLRRMVLLAVLYSLAACLAINSLRFKETIEATTDLWWHLSAGRWIVQHHAVPSTDPLSAYGMDKPWVAYSWLFEVSVYGFERWMGLMGPVIFMLAVLIGVAIALHHAIRKRTGGFATPIALSAVGLLAMMRLYSARPWLFTLLFFTIELDILFGALDDDSQDRGRNVWLLPPLFALWANLHIQFIYGLAVLLLAVLVRTPELLVWNGRQAGKSGTLRLWAVAALSFLATLLNPYTWRVYPVVLEYMREVVPFQVVSELKASDFRSPLDYLVVVIALAAAFILGRAPLKSSIFPGFLLLSSTLISMRTVRDQWMVVIVGLLIIARGCRRKDIVPIVLPHREAFVLAAMMLVCMFATAHTSRLSNERLAAQVASVFPVKAAEVVKQRKLSGPLYNDFNWGGYLSWRLPDLPVSMDGRTNVHGDERLARSVATWNGLPGWNTDPELNAARLVIGSTQQVLSLNLASNPSYRVIYRDDVAVVLQKINY